MTTNIANYEKLASLITGVDGSDITSSTVASSGIVTPSELLAKQNLDLLQRIENLETVLVSILPDFCQSTASEWIAKKEKELLGKLKDAHFAPAAPTAPSPLSLTGSISQTSTYLEGQNVPVYELYLILTVAGQTTNCTIKLPVQVIKSQIVF